MVVKGLRLIRSRFCVRAPLCSQSLFPYRDANWLFLESHSRVAKSIESLHQNSLLLSKVDWTSSSLTDGSLLNELVGSHSSIHWTGSWWLVVICIITGWNILAIMWCWALKIVNFSFTSLAQPWTLLSSEECPSGGRLNPVVLLWRQQCSCFSQRTKLVWK